MTVKRCEEEAGDCVYKGSLISSSTSSHAIIDISSSEVKGSMLEAIVASCRIGSNRCSFLSGLEAAVVMVLVSSGIIF